MDYNASIAMSPKLIRVGGACYRSLNCDECSDVIDDWTIQNSSARRNGRDQPNKNQESRINKNRYLIDDLERQDIAQEDEEDLRLQLNDGEELSQENDGFVLKIHLCQSFFGYLIGKRGQTKMAIEAETQTLISIPKALSVGQLPKPESNFIRICSARKQSILRALKRVRDLEESFRMKQKPTHFVSIPLSLSARSEVKDRFLQFKSAVLADPKCSTAKCIDEAAFQSEHRLHLTINVLYIGDNYESRMAVKRLEEFRQKTLKTFMSDSDEKIMLHVKGLDIMNDDPTEVNVLYAKVSETNGNDSFREIVNQLYDCFADSGLICESKRTFADSEWKVKVHATLMNIRYWQEHHSNNGDRNHSSKQQKMDVTNILERFGDFDFGHCPLDQIHVSTMGCYEEKLNNYYSPLAKIIL